jgi:hypothetical protein
MGIRDPYKAIHIDERRGSGHDFYEGAVLVQLVGSRPAAVFFPGAGPGRFFIPDFSGAHRIFPIGFQPPKIHSGIVKMYAVLLLIAIVFHCRAGIDVIEKHGPARMKNYYFYIAFYSCRSNLIRAKHDAAASVSAAHQIYRGENI